MRTARSRTSAEYRFAVPINSILSQVEVSRKAGTVQRLPDDPRRDGPHYVGMDDLRFTTYFESVVLRRRPYLKLEGNYA
jgi:hypothetical protein